MARSVVRCFLLSALTAAGVAHAGTVYVPSPGLATLGGSTYEVQISMTNTAIAARDVKQTLLANDTDGTVRSGTPSSLSVQPGRTSVVKAASSFRGLVELSGGGELRYTARLVGTGPGRMGVYLPVITSDNMIKAGQSIALQGLLSGSGRAVAVAVINLAHQAAQCTASLTRADGTTIGNPTSTLALKPLSQLYIPDVLAGGAASEVRVSLSCTREFFAFALVSDAATGELTYIGPSGNGESLLRLPGEAPGCPVTAACFDVKGLVHQPTSPANAVKRVLFTPAPGTYSKIRLTLDVTAGEFSPQNPAALHMLFWLVRDRNFNMFGYAILRGPETNQALLRHGIGLTHANKLKVVQPLTIVPGKTYHLDYTYDTAAQNVDLAISDGSGAVTHLTSKPNVGSFSFAATEKLIIDMGFPGTNPDEAPTFGWTYRDLHVELYK
jgi:hypothetical protein